MLIVMTSEATEADIQQVVTTIEALGLKAHPMPGATRRYGAIPKRLVIVPPRREAHRR